MTTSGSGHLVPAEFRTLAQEVATIARMLNDYLRETGVDVKDSLAASEYAQEANYSDANFVDPVLHVLLQAQHGLVAAADHMLGLAACIRAEDVLFASFSLLRPIVTAAGTTYHLLEPEIPLRERLRRGVNFELDSAREQLNGIDPQSSPDMWQRTADVRDRYLTWGGDHGFGQDAKNARYGEKRYWLTDRTSAKPPPSDMKLAEDVLAAMGDGGIGKAAYRFTSSFIHAQGHAFTMLRPAENQYDPQTPDAVPMGLDLDDLVTWLMVATMAVHLASARSGRYFDWNLRLWAETTRPILARWSAMLGE
jgi:hypothetical protein